MRAYALSMAVLLCACGVEAQTARPDCESNCDLLAATSPEARTVAAGRARPARRVALLIGIADYQHFDLNGPPGQSDLEGPAQDLQRIRISLRGRGFDGEDVRILRDADASRRGILEGLDWLASRADQEDDAVVIYYSGHGSWTRDLNGDEAQLVAGDTVDEALVPWDARDIKDPKQLVLDDEIGAKLESILTKNVTMIVDACFSGTMTRGGEVAPKARPRGLPGNPGGGVGLESNGPGHVLITAASATELAHELAMGDDSKVYGIFTYHLTQVLDGASPTSRYDEIMRDVRLKVRGALVNQTPQLEGQGDARLFHVHGDVPQRAFAVARPLSGSRVRLDVGAVHGVRNGARYHVYPAGETAFAPGEHLAEVRIETIEETAATAMVETAGAQVPDRARAVLARVPRGAGTLEKLRVYVSPGARPDWEAARVGTDFVAVVDDPGRAHVELRDTAGTYQVLFKGKPLKPLSRDSAWTVRRDGVAGYAGTGEAFCSVLARAFAVQAFQLVENPEPQQNFNVEVQVVEAGEQPSQLRDLGAIDTTYIDPNKRYHIYVRVSAPDVKSIYVTAAIEGLISEPYVLWPARTEKGRNSPFPLNEWVRITRPSTTGARYGDGRFSMSPPAGLEIIRVVADADQQYDFWSLWESLPGCTGSKGLRGPTFGGGDVPLGWVAVPHRVVVLATPSVP